MLSNQEISFSVDDPQRRDRTCSGRTPVLVNAVASRCNTYPARKHVKRDANIKTNPRILKQDITLKAYQPRSGQGNWRKTFTLVERIY